MNILGLEVKPDIYENVYVADYKDPYNERNIAPQKALLYRNLLGNCTIIFTRKPSKPLEFFYRRVEGYDNIKFVVNKKEFTKSKGSVLENVNSDVIVAFTDGYNEGFLRLVEKQVSKLEENFRVKVVPLVEDENLDIFTPMKRYRYRNVVFTYSISRSKVVYADKVRYDIIEQFLFENSADFVVFASEKYFWSKRNLFLSMDSAKYRWIYVFFFKGIEVLPCPYMLSQPSRK